MHEALCRPSGTTLDIVHAERRAADHSANIGSSAASVVVEPEIVAAMVPPILYWCGLWLSPPLVNGLIVAAGNGCERSVPRCPSAKRSSAEMVAAGAPRLVRGLSAKGALPKRSGRSTNTEATALRARSLKSTFGSCQTTAPIIP